jgi:hypothetical protein
MRRAVSLAFILMMCAASAAPQSAPTKPIEALPQPQARNTASDADVEAMRADLAHMRILVGQMQRNLGFVDSGLTPLKHQFELEIEMWNLLINDMQRRLNARGGPAFPPASVPQGKPPSDR